jgi:hypothetical protein
MARRRLEFEPGLAGAEAAKLNKFSDASGTQIQWLPDAARTDFSITSGILRPRYVAKEIIGSIQNLASPSGQEICTCIRVSSLEKKKNRKGPSFKTVGLMKASLFQKI